MLKRLVRRYKLILNICQLRNECWDWLLRIDKLIVRIEYFSILYTYNRDLYNSIATLRRVPGRLQVYYGVNWLRHNDQRPFQSLTPDQ